MVPAQNRPLAVALAVVHPVLGPGRLDRSRIAGECHERQHEPEVEDEVRVPRPAKLHEVRGEVPARHRPGDILAGNAQTIALVSRKLYAVCNLCDVRSPSPRRSAASGAIPMPGIGGTLRWLTLELMPTGCARAVCLEWPRS